MNAFCQAHATHTCCSRLHMLRVHAHECFLQGTHTNAALAYIHRATRPRRGGGTRPGEARNYWQSLCRCSPASCAAFACGCFFLVPKRRIMPTGGCPSSSGRKRARTVGSCTGESRKRGLSPRNDSDRTRAGCRRGPAACSSTLALGRLGRWYRV